MHYSNKNNPRGDERLPVSSAGSIREAPVTDLSIANWLPLAWQLGRERLRRNVVEPRNDLPRRKVTVDMPGFALCRATALPGQGQLADPQTDFCRHELSQIKIKSQTKERSSPSVPLCVTGSQSVAISKVMCSGNTQTEILGGFLFVLFFVVFFFLHMVPSGMRISNTLETQRAHSTGTHS